MTQEKEYITIKDYLSTPQGNIKSIKFYDSELKTLTIKQEGITLLDDNSNLIWEGHPLDMTVYADRDNKTIYTKFHDDEPIAFSYTTNETVFET